MSNTVCAAPVRSCQRPKKAALLSMLLPGMGQLYNRSPHWPLYCSIAVINLFLLSCVLFTGAIVEAIQRFSHAANLQLNQSFLEVLHHIHWHVPSLIIIGTFALAFTLFSMRDAYRKAQQRTVEQPATGEPMLHQALAASYAVHIGGFTLCCLFFSFFIAPAREQENAIVLEFVAQTANEKNDQFAENISLKSAKDHGKHDPSKEISKTHASSAARDSSPADESRAQEKPSAQKPAQQITPQRSPAATKPERKQAQEKKKPNQPKIEKAKPSPIAKAIAPAEKQKPVKAREQAGAKAQPATRATPLRTASAGGSNKSLASIASPALPGSAFNQRRNIDDQPGSVAARADVDFGPYMAQLQRRMKRSWSPPRGAANKKVKVFFKIHPDGGLSHLRLGKSSGHAACDRAALDAVVASAPFMRLPGNYSEPVDIEFTFDYGNSPNVLHF